MTNAWPPLLADGETPAAAALLGQGYLAFTCDQGPDMDRYQGIVAIEGDDPDRDDRHLFPHLRADRAPMSTWPAPAPRPAGAPPR